MTRSTCTNTSNPPRWRRSSGCGSCSLDPRRALSRTPFARSSPRLVSILSLHALRRAEAADVVPLGPPDHGHRLRIPGGQSRRLVQRARPADQLVAPSSLVPDTNAHEFRPGELRSCRPEHLGRLRLLPEHTLAVSTTAYGVAERAPGPARSSRPHGRAWSSGHSAPGAGLLFSGAQLHSSIPNSSGPGPLQRGLPHGRHRRSTGRHRCSARGHPLHGHRDRDFVSVSDERPSTRRRWSKLVRPASGRRDRLVRDERANSACSCRVSRRPRRGLCRPSAKGNAEDL